MTLTASTVSQQRPANTSAAPIEIDHVALMVRDFAGLRDFYREVVGLEVLAEAGGSVTLGAGDRVLLRLERDTAARPGNPREAGLFHTAFLLPDRAALGRWLLHAAGSGRPLQGASDHRVSEAIYLSDPEGNGIEIYADRPRDSWPRDASGIAMTTEPLDIPDLLAAGERAGGALARFPLGTVVGHVHLQVGALPPTADFYHGQLGLDLATRYPGANFWGWGGYHHHLATNIWNSRGAGPRPAGTTGLLEVALRADADRAAAMPARLTDPWGLEFSVTPKPA